MLSKTYVEREISHYGHYGFRRRDNDAAIIAVYALLTTLQHIA
jgi:hypothetical protein